MGEDLLELTDNGLYFNFIHLRDGLFCGLLCRLVSNTCAAHAVDGGDERDFFGHHHRHRAPLYRQTPTVSPSGCHLPQWGRIYWSLPIMGFISILSIFVMACFVGYYVVWSVTPALHTPLMAVTNAISSVIIVGALIAGAAGGSPTAKWLGLIAVALASVNIFGGFAVTARMLAMYKKKER